MSEPGAGFPGEGSGGLGLLPGTGHTRWDPREALEGPDHMGVCITGVSTASLERICQNPVLNSGEFLSKTRREMTADETGTDRDLGLILTKGVGMNGSMWACCQTSLKGLNLHF